MSNSQTMSSLEYRVGDQPVPGYTLVRELGRGAMGVVWLAQTGSGFERALKVINLQQRGGKKEYRGLRTIKQRKLLHGNLLTLIDYWLKDRDGNFIPDSDDLGDSDSFFGPTKDRPPASSPLAATAAQGMGTTNAEVSSATRADVARPASPSASSRPSSATLVSRGTFTDSPDTPTDQTGGGDLKHTIEMPGAPRPAGKRPVQLIVAMELGHKTLDDRQKQCHEDRAPGVPADELLTYMEQAARGLDYLHREGIVHRDVKPQNIMLVGDVAKVCDYGLIITTDFDLRATSNAFTPLYASPEAVADKPVTAQSDQYSLAVTYIELRTGRVPYASETAASVYAAKETGKYDLTRIRKKAVRNCLKKALARTPNERYGTCSQFIRELEKAEHSHRGVFWAATAASVLALAGIGGVIFVPGVRERLGGLLAGKSVPNGDDSVDSDRSKEKPVDPRPSVVTTPQIREVVDKAREMRLAGRLDEAQRQLDELNINADSTDPAHWPYHLERLHLEVARHFDAPATAATEQWQAWRQTAQRLAASRGQPQEQAQLAALDVFLATKLDGMQINFDQPLADGLARLSESKDQWAKVFSPSEQSRLTAYYDTLAQKLVSGREPLTEPWLKRLAEIWPPETMVRLMRDRARECFRSSESKGLANAMDELEQAAAYGDVEAVPAARAALAEVRLELAEAQSTLAAQSLAKYLTKDEFGVNSEARKQLIDELDALSEMNNAGQLPLARLLRVEATLADHDADDKRYPQELVDEVRAIIPQLSNSTGSATQGLLDYARFLLARLEIHFLRAGMRPAGLQADVLSNWPEGSSADWHTPRRTQQAIDALVRLGDATLPVSERDAVKFQDLPRDWPVQAAAAVSYLEKAQRLGGQSGDLLGLLAVGLAVGARESQQPDAWTRIAELTDQALGAWGSVGDASRRARLPSVQYVSALAASRVGDAAAVARNRRAITTFATLLKPFFSDDAPKNTSTDRGILENIVLPGLRIQMPDNEIPAADLAALWGAKARIIERNPTREFLSLEGVSTVEENDDYASAMLTAHEAYSRAAALADDVIYAAGAARTPFKLPRSLFNWSKYRSALEQTLARRSQEELERPSLLFADACVLRHRALAASSDQRMTLLQAALDRFDKIEARTRDADPYAIRGLALCAASDSYLRAAYWTPIRAADEAKLADAKDTKYFFLTQAVAAAEAAQSDVSLLLPEESRIARGNALEDFGLYYKETDSYPRAVEAFHESVEKAQRRPKAYGLMNLGRCQFRWAIDAARIDSDAALREKELREAYQSLTDAVAHAKANDPTVAHEAAFWLAMVSVEAARNGPGTLEGGVAANRGFRTAPLATLRQNLGDPSRKADAAKEIADRIQQMERARKMILQAAQDARGSSEAEWANYLPDAIALGQSLAAELKATEKEVPVSISSAAMINEARSQAQELLAFADKRPGRISPRTLWRVVNSLVQLERAADPQQSTPKITRMLEDYERLFLQDNDEARAQLVLFLLARASFLNAASARDAEEAARRITNPVLASWARGYCEKFKADVLFRDYRDKLRAYRRDPTTSKALTLADDPKLKAVQLAFAAAMASFSQAGDLKTAENLRRLGEAPLAEVESGKWHAGLTELEAESLRLNVEETERSVRGPLFELLEARLYLHAPTWKLKENKPPDAEFRQVLQQTRDCLKPMRFVEVRFAESKLDDFLRDLLRACEARL